MTRYHVTSAIPHVNGVKHLGNPVGSLLPADVHARFRRSNGARSCLSAPPTSTGTPAELERAAATQAGM